MRIIDCPNRKHKYDADKFDACPYCSPSASKGGRPDGNNDGETESYFAPGEDSGIRVSYAHPVQPGNRNYRGMNSLPDQNTMRSGTGKGSGQMPRIPAGQPNTDYSGIKEEESTVSIYAYGNSGPESGKDSIPQWKFPESQGDVTISVMAASDSWKSQFEPVVGWLVCIEGAGRGCSYVLHAGKNFIGRKSTYDVFLPDDKYVSRDVHASIIYEPKQNIFYAQPGDSHSLFYLNDKVVLTNIQLNDRDILEVGRTKLMFVPFCNEKFSWKAE